MLAAGRSSRMGARDKLLVEIEGRPMVRRAADALSEAGVAPRVAVIASDAVGALLRDFEHVGNPRPEDGLASSLRLGLDALRGRVDAALVVLGDLPWVRAEHAHAVVAAFDPATDLACVPTFDDRRGHPVLLSAGLFDELAALEGDAGARVVLARHADRVKIVSVIDAGILRDVDTPGAL